jgi:hypothetical protein
MAEKKWKQDPTRLGRCYELAWKEIMSNGQGILIHCTLYSYGLKKRIGHAFIEYNDIVVWDPVSDRYLDKEDTFGIFQVGDIHRYGVEEASVKTALYKTFGPWE